MALSTRPTATASTPRLARRSGSNVAACGSSAFQSQALDRVRRSCEACRDRSASALARIAGGGLRLVALAQHHIGAQQPLPAFDIVAVLLAVGRPSRATMPRIISPRSFSLMFAAAATSAALGPGGAAASGGAGAASPMLASACCTVAVQGAPAGACASMSRQIAAALALSPSCSAATPMKKRALGSLLSSATARSKAALASTVTMPLAAAVSASPRSACRCGGFARERDHLAIGVDGVVEAPEPQIDRRQHVVAARVVRIFFEMRLDLRDQLGDRARFRARPRAARRAARPAIAASRAQDKARPRRAAATPARRRRSRGGGAAANRRFHSAYGLRAIGGGDQPARHLDLARPRLRLRRSARSRGRGRSRRADRGRPRPRCRRRPRERVATAARARRNIAAAVISANTNHRS